MQPRAKPVRRRQRRLVLARRARVDVVPAPALQHADAFVHAGAQRKFKLHARLAAKRPAVLAVKSARAAIGRRL